MRRYSVLAGGVVNHYRDVHLPLINANFGTDRKSPKRSISAWTLQAMVSPVRPHWKNVDKEKLPIGLAALVELDAASLDG